MYKEMSKSKNKLIYKYTKKSKKAKFNNYLFNFILLFMFFSHTFIYILYSVQCVIACIC